MEANRLYLHLISKGKFIRIILLVILSELILCSTPLSGYISPMEAASAATPPATENDSFSPPNKKPFATEAVKTVTDKPKDQYKISPSEVIFVNYPPDYVLKKFSEPDSGSFELASEPSIALAPQAPESEDLGNPREIVVYQSGNLYESFPREFLFSTFTPLDFLGNDSSSFEIASEPSIALAPQAPESEDLGNPREIVVYQSGNPYESFPREFLFSTFTPLDFLGKDSGSFELASEPSIALTPPVPTPPVPTPEEPSIPREIVVYQPGNLYEPFPRELLFSTFTPLDFLGNDRGSFGLASEPSIGTKPETTFVPVEDTFNIAPQLPIPQVGGGVSFNSLPIETLQQPEGKTNNPQQGGETLQSQITPAQDIFKPTPPVPVPTLSQEQIDDLIENAMSSTALRYPWVLNSSDSLSFSPLLFKPKQKDFYLNLDLRWSEENPVVNQITFGLFPDGDQLYWVLDDNRVVIETKGIQGGIIYQGLERNVNLVQTMVHSQSFAGYQAVWVIPNDLQRLFKVDNLNDYTVISAAGQLINPEGAPTGEVIVDTGINKNDPNVVILPKPTAFINDIGVGSTRNPRGGGSLFENLELENSPMILQAFPTTNLKPFAILDLKEDTIVSKKVLEKAGISWGNVFTGERAQFKAPVTSIPGIKIGQGDKFDNKDLLNNLVNPYLTKQEKDRAYLNSLHWVGFGTQPVQFETVTTLDTSEDWYRFYLGISHNRVMIQYDPEETEATYFNLFANPGLSMTFTMDRGDWDKIQSLNSSIGMLMGGVFELFNIRDINDSLDEAKELKEDGKPFSNLVTKSSPEERKAMNKRLNSTLAYGSYSSSLRQVSGLMTLPSKVTPKKANIFQIKTGNIQRAVQFLRSDVGDWREGKTFISDARFSNETFGPLTFMGNLLPNIPPTRIDPTNESSAAEVVLVSPEGRKFVQQFDSQDLTTVPVGIKIFDSAFDRFVLQRNDPRKIQNQYFDGYLYLPTIELGYAGSSGDANYSLNTGIWFNLDPKSAPGIDEKNYGFDEPSVGFYVNGLFSLSKTKFSTNENNQVTGISTHVPSLRFNWNSAHNANNPWQISLSYTFARQTRKMGYSLTAAAAAIEDYGNGSIIGILNGQLGFGFGLSSNFNMEIGNTTYYYADIMQQVIPNISIGPYISNYTSINRGFNSRIEAFTYGLVLEHKFPDSPTTLQVKIGTGEEGFESSINGQYRF